jgi:hypothetical protein
MTMPRRPINRTPTTAAPARKSEALPPLRRRPDYSNEGKGDSKYIKKTMTPESQAIERVYPEQALGGVGGAGIKGVAALASKLANRGAATSAKEAPAAVSAARGALDRAMAAEKTAPAAAKVAEKAGTTTSRNRYDLTAPATSKVAEKAAPAGRVKRAAPDPKIAEKISEGLRNAPKPVSKPTAAQKEWAKGPRMGKFGRGAADTLDEFGGAMKRGGSVKKMASGGSTGSFRSSANGIAQRGKTRGKMC